MPFGDLKKQKNNTNKNNNDQAEFKMVNTQRLLFREANAPNQVYYAIKYKKADGSACSRAAIRKFAQQKSKELKEDSPDSVYFSVALKFGDTWRAGSRTLTGNPVSIWDETDSDVYNHGEVDEFSITFTVPK